MLYLNMELLQTQAKQQKYPPPSNVQEVKPFAGFASYYRCFILRFAEITALLHNFTWKSVKFQWTNECQRAFEGLKSTFVRASGLAFPSCDVPFWLYTDALDHGIGAVLSQLQDGAERVIAYASRQLTKAERRGPATEKEALVMIWSIKQFHHYLIGHKFLPITDYQPQHHGNDPHDQPANGQTRHDTLRELTICNARIVQQPTGGAQVAFWRFAAARKSAL